MVKLEILNNIVDRIKSSRHLYLKDGKTTEKELSENLVDDAKCLGAKATIENINDWWIIFSDIDWLSIGHDRTIHELFNNLEGLDNAPQNAFRREVLLTAFTDKVLTWKGDETEFIKGLNSFPDNLLVFRTKLNQNVRAVAFCGILESIVKE